MSIYYKGMRVYQCICCTREKLVDYDFGRDRQGKLYKVCKKCSSHGRLKYHCYVCHKEELTASDFESDKQGKQFELCNDFRKKTDNTKQITMNA